MTFKQKWANFWYYHKGKVIVALVAAFAVVFGLVQCAKNPVPDFAFAYVATQQIALEPYQRGLDGLKEQIPDQNGNGTIDLTDNLYILSPGFSNTNYTMVQKTLTTELIGGYSRLYLADKDLLAEQAGSDLFRPLNGLVPEEMLEGGVLNENGEVIGVSLEASRVLAELGMSSDNVYAYIRKPMEEQFTPEGFEDGYLETALKLIALFRK